MFIGVVTCVACGGDDAEDADKKAKPDAGSTENSVKGGSGGSTAAGRGGQLPRMTANQNASAYTCKPKPEDSGGIGKDGSRCCAGMGQCTGDVSEGLSHGFPRDTCSAEEELRCVPNMREIMASEGEADAGPARAFAACRVSFPGAPPEFPDYEGRCLPSCFAAQNPIAGRLQQGTCSASEKCAPCFDPLTGKATGSCELQGDSPTQDPPTPFAECADGQGYCVPAFAAGMQAGQLAQLTCAAGELCGPKNKVADPNACFAHCDAGMFGPGACVPAFLASVGAGLLPRAECDEGLICGPCELFGSRTGVCD